MKNEDTTGEASLEIEDPGYCDAIRQQIKERTAEIEKHKADAVNADMQIDALEKEAGKLVDEIHVGLVPYAISVGLDLAQIAWMGIPGVIRSAVKAGLGAI